MLRTGAFRSCVIGADELVLVLHLRHELLIGLVQLLGPPPHLLLEFGVGRNQVRPHRRQTLGHLVER
jgi:hypothetical protein